MAIRAYHRPVTLDDALSLLESGAAAVLAGGTVINADPAGPPEVVDLQALGLGTLSSEGGTLHIGAMARLQALVDGDRVPPILQDLARREGASTIRNAATVGGTVAAVDPESELLAGLLAYDASVTIARPSGTEEIGLDTLLADRSQLEGGVITAITFATDGTAAAERTGRTPTDRPIVVAVARRSEAEDLRVAVTGVAATPVVVDPGNLDTLDPPSDFRGSAEYRNELARILTARAVESVGA